MDRKKSSITIVSILAVLLVPVGICTGCSSNNHTTEPAFSETEAFLNRVYGDFSYSHDQDEFSFSFGDGSTAVFAPETNESQEIDLIHLQFVGTEWSREIGYAVRYSIQMEPDYMLPCHFFPQLQVFLDNRWWTITTQVHIGWEVGVWILDSFEHDFLFPMIARGSEEPLPDGKYRIWLSPVTGCDFPISIEFTNNLSQSASCYITEQTMKDNYPQTWAFFRQLYGDYFRFNDDGDFVWQHNTALQTMCLPEDEIEIYNEEDFEFTFIEVFNDNHVGSIAIFTLSNKTSQMQYIINQIPDLQIYLDDKWWGIALAYVGRDLRPFIELPKGKKDLSIPLCAQQTFQGLPNGHYRLLIELMPISESFLAAVFDLS